MSRDGLSRYGKPPSINFQLASLPTAQLLTVNEKNILALCETHITKENILEKYKVLFTGLGKLAGNIYIDVDSIIPSVRMPLRRLPIAVKDKVRIKLEQMVNQSIIVPEPEPSLWISALIIVTKPNGDFRICIDPKPLKKALRRNHYPLPTIDDFVSVRLNEYINQSINQ